MEFPGTKRVVFEVDAFDLGDFIAHHYQLSNFSCILESSNDSTHTFIVCKEQMFASEEKDIAAYKENEECEISGVGTVMKDLCNKGIVEPGKYLVNVCW